ncbi:MAG: hypothetical protein M1824_000884, partial [Vezdaea acicularis]
MQQYAATVVSSGMPSPTLTNPDMILPYDSYSYDRADTPSPPPQTMRPPSLQRRSSAGLSSHPPYAKLARPPPPAGRSSISPRTTPPPPHEFHDHGRPLSDIQEAESTPKGLRSRNDLLNEDVRDDPVLASSPTLASPPNGTMKGHFQPRPGFGQRRPSSSSPAILSDGDDAADYEAIDDNLSADGDTMFGEDDEDLAELENINRLRNARLEYHGGVNGTIPEEGQDPYLSAALSKRAERILANAKKRLDVSMRIGCWVSFCEKISPNAWDLQNMEGNLNRARHSLVIAPSPLMNTSAGSSPKSLRAAGTSTSPSQHDDPRIHPPLGKSPAKHRQLSSNASSSKGSGHARIFSETSIPSSLYTSPKASHSTSSVPRTTSALEAVGLARTPLERSSPPDSVSVKGTRYQEILRESGARSSPAYTSQRRISPSEGAARRLESPTHDQPISRTSASRTLNPSASLHSISSSVLEDAPNTLNRSRSTAQMRDLRVQMKDLKGKISSLQQRAREDGLKRRSLQSLRTPSPFTAAEQWYTGYNTNELGANIGAPEKEERSGMGGAAVVHGTPPKDELEHGVHYEESVGPSQYEDADEEHQLEEKVSSTEHHQDDRDEIPRDLDEFEEPYVHGLVDHSRNEVVDEYTPDHAQNLTEQKPRPSSASERHEDREDAFDYQNFFLHSGMGNYSQEHLGSRHRSDSYSSTDSIETTKAAEEDAKLCSYAESNAIAAARMHRRNDSTDTVSTVATFATATEGLGSEYGDGEEDVVYTNGIDATNAQYEHPLIANGGAIHAEPEDEDWLGARSDGSHTPTKLSTAKPGRPSPSIQPPDHNNNNAPPKLSPQPSIASLASATSLTSTRSFPLVNRPKSSTSSASQPSSSILVSYLTGSASPPTDTGSTPALQLHSTDRVLVERLVESLGQVCVGLRGDEQAENQAL